MSPDDVHPDVFDSDDDLAAFAADLRAAAAATPQPVVRQELAQLFERGLPPVAAPTAARSRRPQLVRRIAIAAGALVVGTGGLGVAGALPAPVQQTVADVAEIIGVQLPSPEERPSEHRPADVPAPATPPGLDTVVPETPAGTVPATPPSTVPARPDTPPADRSRGEEQRETADERQAPEAADERPGTADARSSDARGSREEPEVPADERSAERPEAADPPAAGHRPDSADAPAPASAPEAQPLPASPGRPDAADPGA